MGLFTSNKSQSSGAASADAETQQVEKMIATEAKNEQRNFDRSLKDVAKLDKSHERSLKAADSAQHALDKAVKNEYESARALNEAEHKHDNAMASQRSAAKTLELKVQQEGRLGEDLQQRRASLDRLQQRKASNDAVRESKLTQIHQHASDSALARAGSLDVSHDIAMSPVGVDEVHDAAQGAGTGTTGVDANGTAVGAGDG